MSNAEKQEQMNAGSRSHNNTFRFDDGEGQGSPAVSLALEALQKERRHHTQDGQDLSDEGKLYRFVEKLVEGGMSEDKIAYHVNGMFFEEHGLSYDKVSRVVMSGGEVVVEFTSSSGLHFVPGKIHPLRVKAPKRYDGEDTNSRGAQVGAIQNMVNGDQIPRDGTFLRRNAREVELLFHETRKGAAYKGRDPSELAADRPYQRILREYEVSLMVDYVTKLAHQLKEDLGNIRGQTPQQLTTTAIQLVIQYDFPNLAATPHTTIELQDEAIVQRALEELGVEVDVDTDLETSRLPR